MKKLILLLALLGASVLGGCATPTGMAFDKETKTLKADSKAIVLLAVTMDNEFKPSFQPDARILYVETPNADKKADRLNFIMDREGTIEKDGKKIFLFRGSLKPGQYVLQGVAGQVNKILVISNCLLPIRSDMTIDQPGIYYLGRVDGVVRERKDDKEFKAGPTIPLIDQAVAGFSTGTWEVNIHDDSAEDLALYREHFPVLQSADIKMHLLHPFDRARAQKWWEEH